jgi:hypothetical protein
MAVPQLVSVADEACKLRLLEQNRRLGTNCWMTSSVKDDILSATRDLSNNVKI